MHLSINSSFFYYFLASMFIFLTNHIFSVILGSHLSEIGPTSVQSNDLHHKMSTIEMLFQCLLKFLFFSSNFINNTFNYNNFSRRLLSKKIINKLKYFLLYIYLNNSKSFVYGSLS